MYYITLSTTCIPVEPVSDTLSNQRSKIYSAKTKEPNNFEEAVHIALI